MNMLSGKIVIFFGCSAVVVIMIAGALSMADSRPASAKPEFSAQTGLPCGRCHVNPAGGGKNTPYGEKFKENGYKVPKK